MIPSVTAGGSKATATMTPTRVVESPVVRDRAAAAPEAKARAIASRPAWVRDSNSELDSS